jgi:hypothetical protein
MPLPRGARARLLWALELALGLELYACAVLALHAHGLRATPLEASAALVLPALVIPPVFYLLVSLVSVRPLSLGSVIGSMASMCVLHALLVAATGALFMIPDLLDYGAAVVRFCCRPARRATKRDRPRCSVESRPPRSPRRRSPRSRC